MRIGDLVCVILLTTSGLFAAEQSVADKAWSVLEAGLHDQKGDRRALAVSALGLMADDEKAIATAEHALQDPDGNVSRAAITALGDMNSKKSLPKLKALISHSDAKTVVAVAAVLYKFKDPEGFEIYYEILTGERKGGGSILDGIKDRKGLEKMGVESAIGFLPGGSIGTGAYNYLRQNESANSNIYLIAVKALEHDPDPIATRALVKAAFDNKDVIKVVALQALARRGDRGVVDKIEPAMYSDKPVISYTAAATVLHLLDLPAKQQARRRSGA